MKILVTFAVDAEFAAWRRRHAFREVVADPFPLYAAEIGGSAVRVLLTGMGAPAASRAIRWALESPVDLCISSGFAGALRPELEIAEVLAARVVHRAERELAVAPDRDLLAAACESGARRVERFLTSESLVTEVAEKKVLAETADAVEMESFVILAEAARHGVRAAAVRAASDTAAAPLPCDFTALSDARGRIRTGALAVHMLLHPGRIPGLLRLARDSRAAAARLADFFDSYVVLLESRLDLSQSEIVTVT